MSTLSQERADALMAQEKVVSDGTPIRYPSPHGTVVVSIVSEDGREAFSLDIERKPTFKRHRKYQLRYGGVVLRRFELDGPEHENPDGTEVGRDHMHVYREGYGDRFAFPLDSQHFPNDNFPEDPVESLEAFLRHCNVTADVQRVLV